MGNFSLKPNISIVWRTIALTLLASTLLLAGCATGPVTTQTRIPRPAPPPAAPQPQQPAMPQPEPGVETMPLERGEPLRPQAMPQPELLPPGDMTVEDVQTAVDVAPEAPSDNPVVVSLLQQADSLAASGQLDRAAASVERGLRIAPKDASLWQKLARIRLEQGKYHQAESMAKKSIALARGRPGMIADNWKLIAEARQARGDAVGAQRALDKMMQYSQ